MSEDIDTWRRELQSVLGAGDGPLREITIFQTIDSTQDAARRMAAKPGQVVVAARQTAGRGRLGRPWADTADEGIAMTLVLPREEGGRLAIAGAVAAAGAAEAFLDGHVGIKWPNDVVVRGRKLAGVLVEQIQETALVGIGLNVKQTHWPDALSARAVSLHQLGAACRRLEALKALLASANRAFQLTGEQLEREFAKRDVLVGRQAVFFSAGEEISGTVLQLDPLRGLLIETGCEQRWLAAATTSLSRR